MSNRKKRKLTLKKLNKKIDKLKDNVEIKNHVLTRAPASHVAGVFSQCLNLMPSGVDSGGRIGIKVSAKYLELNIYIENTAAVTQPFRVILVRDISPQGIALNTDRMFSMIGSNIQKIISLNDFRYTEDFKIYYDKSFSLSGTNNDNNYTTKFIKIRQILRFNQLFNGTTNNIADLEMGALYLVVIFDDANNLFGYNSKYRYIDA